MLTVGRFHPQLPNDVEAPGGTGKPEQEKTYDTSTAIFWLAAWLFNNLFITLMNKAVFSHYSFPYPYSRTAVHMLCNTAGAYIFLAVSKTVKQKNLDSKQKKTLLWFSLLFAANIVGGNVSLQYVSVAFNQVLH